MAKKEKIQPDSDGVIRLAPGIPRGAVTLTGLPIREGDEGHGRNHRGEYVLRKPTVSDQADEFVPAVRS